MTTLLATLLSVGAAAADAADEKIDVLKQPVRWRSAVAERETENSL